MNQPSVLIVDDEPDNFDVIEALLGDCGYDLHYAVDGRHAIDSLDIFQPDLLLLDVMMPNVDGLEVCQWMNDNPRWKFTPIVIVTALNSKEDLARCLAAGADDFVSKPVNRLELRARINSMLRIKRQHDLLQTAIVEIEQAKAAAEAATKAKSDFLAMMSHEIRTPITSVLGMTQLLATTPLTAQQQKYVQTTQVSGEMLLCTIDDILDFSKIESGQLALEQRPLDLHQLLQDIVDLLAPKASAQKLELTSTLTADVPQYIVSDVTRLRQVLLNLVNNAIKFTPTGSVTISCQTSLTAVGQHELHFSVTDTGIGIAAEDIDRLFQPFTQASISTTREYGGTGLGLTICRRLIEMMQGKIWIESNLGRGTTFHFTLVTAPSDALSAQLCQQRAVPLAATSKQRQLGMAMPLSILIADDNQIARELAVAMFEQMGYTPDIVKNGLEVIAAVRAKFYDMLFLDLHMPELDGLATVKYLMKEWGNFGLTYHRPKIVAMTANALQGDREICLAAGMDDYVSKPVLVDTLERVLWRWGQPDSSLPELSIIASKILSFDRFDRTAIERLSEVSPTLPQRLISLFLNEEAPKLLELLAASLQGGDFAAIRTAAHTFGGTSNALGARRLAYLCQQLETNGALEALDSIERQISQIAMEYQLVQRELVQLIAPS